MSVSVSARSRNIIGLSEFMELYRQGKYDASDPESLVEAAPILAALNNNKDFLGEFILDQLKTSLSYQRDNFYGPAVLKLGNPTETTMMRANIWAAKTDDEYKRAPKSFVYGVPHDHNFNFLTIGHFGPGYSSLFYEYDYETVEGYTGEKPSLNKIGYKTLKPDQVMLYRAHQDIHCQYAPESLSITINVMDVSPDHLFKDQYIFDKDMNSIDNVISQRCSPDLFEVAGALGDEEITECLIHISEKHDSSYARASAFRSAVRSIENEKDIDALLSKGFASGCKPVALMAERLSHLVDHPTFK